MSLNYSEILHQLQNFYWQLNQQSEKISLLEGTVEQLTQQLNQLKENQPCKIEYKFDQLKVEKLEGTLNIGFSPQSAAGSIDDFTIEQQEVNVPTISPQHSGLFSEIQHQVYDYLDRNCYQDFALIEEKNKYPLDDQYRKLIADDIKNQIDPRIQHYIDQCASNIVNEENMQEYKEKTIEKVIEDIKASYGDFIRKLPYREDM
jgi:spore germination protein PC